MYLVMSTSPLLFEGLFIKKRLVPIVTVLVVNLIQNLGETDL